MTVVVLESWIQDGKPLEIGPYRHWALSQKMEGVSDNYQALNMTPFPDPSFSSTALPPSMTPDHCKMTHPVGMPQEATKLQG